MAIESDFYDSTEEDEYYIEAKILRSEQKQIEIRKLTGIMEFLGDAGGI